MTRDTRRLLAAAGVALALLWVLARLRFPDTPATVNPVPPLLAQLAPPPRLATLAADIAATTARLRGEFSIVPVGENDGVTTRVALRLRPGLAATVVTTEGSAFVRMAWQAIAGDRVTGLMVVPVAESGTPAVAPAWSPTRLDEPRFLLASQVSRARTVTLSPIFVAALSERRSVAWNATVWQLPVEADVVDGSFLATPAGELVGVAAEDEGQPVIVPTAVLVEHATALLDRPVPIADGWLGLAVAPLTPAVARATGVSAGVVVTRVEPGSPATGALYAGDVVTHLNDAAVDRVGEWLALTARLRAGESVKLGVHRVGGEREAVIAAVELPPRRPPTIGARLGRASGGTQVLSLLPDSAVEAAGLRAGDVVTRIADVMHPTPEQFRQAYEHAPPDGSVLIAFTRGGEHHVAALDR